MSKAFEDRVNSYIYSMVTYRDTSVLENRHASGLPLDMDFYDEMFWELHKQFTWFHKVFCRLQNQTPEGKEEKRAYIMAYNYMKSADKWDEPVKVRDRYKNDLAGFILDGEFKKACEEGKKLNDALMKTINRDVRNRYYTLLSRGIIDPKDYSKEVGLRDNEIREYFAEEIENEVSALPKKRFNPRPIFKASPVPESKLSDLLTVKNKDLFPLVIIEVRTTGNNQDKDEILEMAAIKYKDGFKAADSFRIACRPLNKTSKTVYEAYNLSDEFIETCLPFSAYRNDIQKFIDGCNGCGYSLKNQLGFLYKNGIDFADKTKFFDVCSLANTVLGNPVDPKENLIDDFKLSTVLDYYRIYGNEPSDALENCLLITKLMRRILNI